MCHPPWMDTVGISFQHCIIHLLSCNVKGKNKKEAILSLFYRNLLRKLELYFKRALFAGAEDDEREGITPIVTSDKFGKRVVEVNFGPID